MRSPSSQLLGEVATVVDVVGGDRAGEAEHRRHVPDQLVDREVDEGLVVEALAEPSVLVGEAA